MRKIIRIGSLLMVSLAAFPVLPVTAAGINLEIFYLPHRPAMVVVDKVEQVAKEFADVTIHKYSFDDPKNHTLLEKYKLTGHIPVAIFINGENNFTVKGRVIHFRNFPKGDAFVPTLAGEWDYDDLRALLRNMAGEK